MQEQMEDQRSENWKVSENICASEIEWMKNTTQRCKWHRSRMDGYMWNAIISNGKLKPFAANEKCFCNKSYNIILLKNFPINFISLKVIWLNLLFYMSLQLIIILSELLVAHYAQWSSAPLLCYFIFLHSLSSHWNWLTSSFPCSIPAILKLSIHFTEFWKFLMYYE